MASLEVSEALSLLAGVATRGISRKDDHLAKSEVEDVGCVEDDSHDNPRKHSIVEPCMNTSEFAH